MEQIDTSFINKQIDFNGTTTIQVTNRTKKLLSDIGTMSETYNDVIMRLLIEHEDIEEAKSTIKELDEDLDRRILSTIKMKKELISDILCIDNKS